MGMISVKKTIRELLQGLEYKVGKGSLDDEISGISCDSRATEKDNIFVAISGFAVDGHDYIPQAIESGAKCIIAEKELEIPRDFCLIVVEDSRKALAVISSRYYGLPSARMKVVGITGTNGKTTTIHILKSIYENLGNNVGLIGTIGASIGNEKIACKNTTPESLELQKILSVMADNKVDYCFMEVSSHALGLNRVFGTNFSSALYTNLSPDHLEFHKDMEDYFQTKKKLFYMTEKYNIINCDDLYGKRLLDNLSSAKAKSITYGINEKADINARNIKYFPERVSFVLVTPKGEIEINLNLPGKVNVYNCLAASAYAYADGISLQEIAQGIGKLIEVKGRFETVYQDEDWRVIIDFAHTEDGLKEVLESVRPFVRGRVLLVFGVYAAPGIKGRSKRLAMGKTAALYADYSIITSDNPKNQDPQEIINEIIEGASEIGSNFISLIDRAEAIAEAVRIARKDDLILITGKGHETAQLIGDIAVPFNEKNIVLEEISKLKTRQVENEKY